MHVSSLFLSDICQRQTKAKQLIMAASLLILHTLIPFTWTTDNTYAYRMVKGEKERDRETDTERDRDIEH